VPGAPGRARGPQSRPQEHHHDPVIGPDRTPRHKCTPRWCCACLKAHRGADLTRARPARFHPSPPHLSIG
jgi:hypothetical protein